MEEDAGNLCKASSLHRVALEDQHAPVVQPGPVMVPAPHAPATAAAIAAAAVCDMDCGIVLATPCLSPKPAHASDGGPGSKVTASLRRKLCRSSRGMPTIRQQHGPGAMVHVEPLSCQLATWDDSTAAAPPAPADARLCQGVVFGDDEPSPVHPLHSQHDAVQARPAQVVRDGLPEHRTSATQEPGLAAATGLAETFSAIGTAIPPLVGLPRAASPFTPAAATATAAFARLLPVASSLTPASATAADATAFASLPEPATLFSAAMIHNAPASSSAPLQPSCPPAHHAAAQLAASWGRAPAAVDAAPRAATQPAVVLSCEEREDEGQSPPAAKRVRFVAQEAADTTAPVPSLRLSNSPLLIQAFRGESARRSSLCARPLGVSPVDAAASASGREFSTDAVLPASLLPGPRENLPSVTDAVNLAVAASHPAQDEGGEADEQRAQPTAAARLLSRRLRCSAFDHQRRRRMPATAPPSTGSQEGLRWDVAESEQQTRALGGPTLATSPRRPTSPLPSPTLDTTLHRTSEAMRRASDAPRGITTHGAATCSSMAACTATHADTAAAAATACQQHDSGVGTQAGGTAPLSAPETAPACRPPAAPLAATASHGAISAGETVSSLRRPNAGTALPFPSRSAADVASTSQLQSPAATRPSMSSLQRPLERPKRRLMLSRRLTTLARQRAEPTAERHEVAVQRVALAGQRSEAAGQAGQPVEVAGLPAEAAEQPVEAAAAAFCGGGDERQRDSSPAPASSPRDVGDDDDEQRSLRCIGHLDLEVRRRRQPIDRAPSAPRPSALPTLPTLPILPTLPTLPLQPVSAPSTRSPSVLPLQWLSASHAPPRVDAVLAQEGSTAERCSSRVEAVPQPEGRMARFPSPGVAAVPEQAAPSPRPLSSIAPESLAGSGPRSVSPVGWFFAQHPNSPPARLEQLEQLSFEFAPDFRLGMQEASLDQHPAWQPAAMMPERFPSPVWQMSSPELWEDAGPTLVPPPPPPPLQRTQFDGQGDVSLRIWGPPHSSRRPTLEAARLGDAGDATGAPDERTRQEEAAATAVGREAGCATGGRSRADLDAFDSALDVGRAGDLQFPRRRVRDARRPEMPARKRRFASLGLPQGSDMPRRPGAAMLQAPSEHAAVLQPPSEQEAAPARHASPAPSQHGTVQEAFDAWHGDRLCLLDGAPDYERDGSRTAGAGGTQRPAPAMSAGDWPTSGAGVQTAAAAPWESVWMLPQFMLDELPASIVDAGGAGPSAARDPRRAAAPAVRPTLRMSHPSLLGPAARPPSVSAMIQSQSVPWPSPMEASLEGDETLLTAMHDTNMEAALVGDAAVTATAAVPSRPAAAAAAVAAPSAQRASTPPHDVISLLDSDSDDAPPRPSARRPPRLLRPEAAAQNPPRLGSPGADLDACMAYCRELVDQLPRPSLSQAATAGGPRRAPLQPPPASNPPTVTHGLETLSTSVSALRADVSALANRRWLLSNRRRRFFGAAGRPEGGVAEAVDGVQDVAGQEAAGAEGERALQEAGGVGSADVEPDPFAWGRRSGGGAVMAVRHTSQRQSPPAPLPLSASTPLSASRRRGAAVAADASDDGGPEPQVYGGGMMDDDAFLPMPPRVTRSAVAAAATAAAAAPSSLPPAVRRPAMPGAPPPTDGLAAAQGAVDAAGRSAGAPNDAAATSDHGTEAAAEGHLHADDWRRQFQRLQDAVAALSPPVELPSALYGPRPLGTDRDRPSRAAGGSTSAVTGGAEEGTAVAASTDAALGARSRAAPRRMAFARARDIHDLLEPDEIDMDPPASAVALSTAAERGAAALAALRVQVTLSADAMARARRLLDPPASPGSAPSPPPLPPPPHLPPPHFGHLLDRPPLRDREFLRRRREEMLAAAGSGGGAEGGSGSSPREGGPLLAGSLDRVRASIAGAQSALAALQADNARSRVRLALLRSAAADPDAEPDTQRDDGAEGEAGHPYSVPGMLRRSARVGPHRATAPGEPSVVSLLGGVDGGGDGNSAAAAAAAEYGAASSALLLAASGRLLGGEGGGSGGGSPSTWDHPSGGNLNDTRARLRARLAAVLPSTTAERGAWEDHESRLMLMLRARQAAAGLRAGPAGGMTSSEHAAAVQQAAAQRAAATAAAEAKEAQRAVAEADAAAAAQAEAEQEKTRLMAEDDQVATEEEVRQRLRSVREHVMELELQVQGGKRKAHTLQIDIRQLEDSSQCAICLDAPRNVAFRCGHTACAACALELTRCHLCRQTITDRRTLF